MIDNIIEVTLIAMLFIAVETLYCFVMNAILPRYALRVRYRIGEFVGRGMKKFTYPEGRAVAYEPNPSIRKYIPKYALFTLDGYKYVRFAIDSGVKSYTAAIVMLDNRDRVIDVIDVSEITGGASSSVPLKLHDRTSYVAVELKSVNDELLPLSPCGQLTLASLCVYAASVVAATLIVFADVFYSVRAVCDMFELESPITVGFGFFILPALAVAAASVLIAVAARVKKGIKVVLR